MPQLLNDKFGRAARFASLMGAAHADLEAYIIANRTDFSKEEYRALWGAKGRQNASSDMTSSAATPFDTWWASERF